MLSEHALEKANRAELIVPIPGSDGTYGSWEISRRSRGLSGVHLIFSGNGESRRHPEASIMISSFSLCTGADAEQD
ncbi:hypothetical protein NQZ68_033339 [Dissostichus eleginoides]|nr:hypothetical protein NQZ68_033339 [Dissostichus eleginoides]